MNAAIDRTDGDAEGTRRAIQRIGFAVVRWFPFGGMQRSLLRLALEAARRGHRLTVFTTAWEGDRPDGIEVEIVPVHAHSKHGLNAAFAGALAARVAARDLDVLVGFNKIPGLDLYYAGDPCFAARLAEGRFTAPFKRCLPRYRALLAQEAAVFGRRSRTEILLFAPTRQAEFSRHHGTTADRFHLLPPGIDRARLDAAIARPADRRDFLVSLGLKPETRHLLTIGSGYRTKGVDRIWQALRRDELAGFHHLVLGADDLAAWERRAERMGLRDRVHLLGPRADVVDFYRHSDVLVHPARTENTGSTLLEAIYCGTPVLCTANCGFAFHVEASRGGIVLPHPFDAESLVQGILEAASPDRREGFRAGGQAYCRSKDLYGLVEAAVDVIESVAAARGRDRRAGS